MATYQKIAKATISGATGSQLEFTSIPQTFTDLVIITSIRSSRSDSAYGNLKMTFNNSTSSLSCRAFRYVGGINTYGGTSIEFSATAVGAGTYRFNTGQIYIKNYASTSHYKSCLIETTSAQTDSGTDFFPYMTTGLWSDYTAISSIQIFSQDSPGTLEQYSSATLYGIKNS